MTNYEKIINIKISGIKIFDGLFLDDIATILSDRKGCKSCKIPDEFKDKGCRIGDRDDPYWILCFDSIKLWLNSECKEE